MALTKRQREYLTDLRKNGGERRGWPWPRQDLIHRLYVLGYIELIEPNSGPAGRSEGERLTTEGRKVLE